MRFSWKALIISPLAVPLAYSAAFTIVAPVRSPLASFLFLFGLGSIFSLAVTALMLLPVLFLVSRFIPLTARLTVIVGAALGVVIYLPIIWQSYLASGDNSGPPQESFASYLQQHLFEADFWAILIGGMVTAALYWLLTKAPPTKE